MPTSAEACQRHVLIDPFCDPDTRGKTMANIVRIYHQKHGDPETNKASNEHSRKSQSLVISHDAGSCGYCRYPNGFGKDVDMRELKKCFLCRVPLFCSVDCQRKPDWGTKWSA
jgi:hypothetical protein